MQENSADVGTYLLTELAKLRDKYEIIGDVRGKGLQIGVEMVKDKVNEWKLHAFNLSVSHTSNKSLSTINMRTYDLLYMIGINNL